MSLAYEFFTDNEVEAQLRALDKTVQPLLIMRWVHIVVSGIITLVMLWSIQAHAHTVASLVFAITSTVAVGLSIFIATVAQAQANYRCSVYEETLRQSADKMQMETRAANMYYSARLGNVEFLRRGQRAAFFSPLWLTDPHMHLIQRFLVVMAAGCGQRQPLAILQVIALVPWLLFYPIFGFYVSLLIWAFYAIRYAAGEYTVASDAAISPGSGDMPRAGSLASMQD